MTKRTCRGITTRGKPCGANPLKPGTVIEGVTVSGRWCRQHDEDLPDSARIGGPRCYLRLTVPKAGPDKRLCGAQRLNQPEGATCTQRAGWGTDHPGVGRCKRHGGATESHQRAAALEIARQECEVLGIPIETTPAEALIREVWEASGNVAFYRRLVQELPTHPEGRIYVPPDGDEGKGYWGDGKVGVYGPTYHVSGIPTGEAKPHVLVVLYNDERKRLVDAASAALKAGVEERRVRIAEADAERIMDAQMKAFAAMGLADRLEEFRGHFAASLTADGEPAHLGALGTG
jgi:hypothetical protein